MELEEMLDKYLQGVPPQALFIDIDGVMTIERGSYVVDLDLVKMLRELMAEGVPVILVSGNAYPVVLTLQRYLGLTPIFIAENGCVIQINKEVQNLCRESLDPIAEEIAHNLGLRPSPSNMYRLCDRAFHIPKEIKNDTKAVRELEQKIMSMYPGIYAYYTGYVLHIYPKYCSKSIAINIVVQKLGLDLLKCIAVGDSVTDVDMVKTVGIGIATGDADEELKKEAKIVLPLRASSSTKILVKTLIEYTKKTKRYRENT
ncbi:MAG: phosphoglycolate phosphatase [Desulfurococcaceae archaeon]|nr:phosphoglycolate phosphatase [Desulfurococcaceae archaeon]